eukprot:TRINITY_DN5104_c0_g1_i2.p1 TRINITY_DN5104_c0_g1~~TRINITY_DN5104_c0_g1_i2.p1  ORF type:complete len:464 (+),score=91.65 TRINITY_DN5104_c0_g1_i2:445-1836(+)
MTRVRCLTKTVTLPPSLSGGIVYWMSRDQRAHHNWALTYAQKLAKRRSLPLYVVFSLVPKFLDSTIRHFDFMLKGLEETSQVLQQHHIPFYLLTGQAKDTVPTFTHQYGITAVVTDFSPLRVPIQWSSEVACALDNQGVPLYQVDAHNVVPAWVATGKSEYGARTIRPKIMNRLNEYLTAFPDLEDHGKWKGEMSGDIDWAAARQSLQVDMSVGPVDWAQPGYRGGMQVLDTFIKARLKRFGDKRNDPTVNALSNLSPWFHFGQVSVQECARRVNEHRKSHPEAVKAFIEESIVRRELADNFCLFNPRTYDSISGGFKWAKDSLKLHSEDKREYLYSREQLAQSQTHDDLWNAAQKQMVDTGKMHGFLRMYWAKKILEWTDSPETALADAIYLNDRYSLDGRDPNGYVGVMWSIVGIHDQGWKERPVFGKIRYMNYAGCKRKFDVAKFVNTVNGNTLKKLWSK